MSICWRVNSFAIVHASEIFNFALQLLEINRRVHKQNNVPKEFPLFVRNGYKIKVVADGYEVAPSGLMYKVRYSMAVSLLCNMFKENLIGNSENALHSIQGSLDPNL